MTRRGWWWVGGLATVVAVQIGLNLVLDARAQRATLGVRVTLAGTRAADGNVRISIHPAGRADELLAEGDGRESLTLPPGRYDVRVALEGAGEERAQWFRDLALEAGERIERRVDFEVGWLGLDPELDDAPGDGLAVIGYVHTAGDEQQVRAVIRPDEEAILPAGTYDVRAVLLDGNEERDVVWLRGIELESGARQRPAVGFRRGTLIVTAHAAGTVLPRGAAELTVHRAGDEQEAVLIEGLAGSRVSLPGGRYDVRITYTDSDDRPIRWLRGVEVTDGQTVERRAEFDSGSLLVEASLGGVRRLGDFDAYVYYYRSGAYREPVAYTPTGQPARLSAGRYDLRVHFFRSHDRPDVWLRDVELPAGGQLERRVDFDSGSLLVRAHDAAGAERIGDEVFVRVHARGERTRPIAVARSGETIVLGAGRYDLGIEDTRHPGRVQWLPDVTVRAGGEDEVRVDLP